MSEPDGDRSVVRIDERGKRLSALEDAELRRLHWFEQLGCQLSDAMAGLKRTIRSRDRRMTIRDPYAAFDPSADRVVPVSDTDGDYWVRIHR